MGSGVFTSYRSVVRLYSLVHGFGVSYAFLFPTQQLVSLLTGIKETFP